jgi:Ca2+-binding RTX toxin-like protein
MPLPTQIDFSNGDVLDVAAIGISDLETVKRLVGTDASGLFFSVTRNNTVEFTRLLGIASAEDLQPTNVVLAPDSTTPITETGSPFDDDLFGQGGNDLLFGNVGNDRLFGGGGNDGLRGEEGDDLLIGGGGNDDLRGGFGADTVEGGEGDDVFFTSAGHLVAGEVIDGGNGVDRLVLGRSETSSGLAIHSLFDVTVTNVESLELVSAEAPVRVVLSAEQFASFTTFTAEEGQVVFTTGGTHRLDIHSPQFGASALYGSIEGSAENDVFVVPDSGFSGGFGDTIDIDGGGGVNTVLLDRPLFDYVITSLGNGAFEVRRDGALEYRLSNIFSVGSAVPEPIGDSIRATIGRDGSIAVADLLANDFGFGLTIGDPVPGGGLTTAQGGFLLPDGANLPQEFLTYRPAPSFTGFDFVEYAVVDDRGRFATVLLNIDVSNTAPEAADLAFTLTPGALIPVADLLAGASDPDLDGVEIFGFGVEPALIGFQSVTDPLTNALLGVRVTPTIDPVTGLFRTTGTFDYRVKDDSGAIGATDRGVVTVTFVPSLATDDALRGTILNPGSPSGGDVVAFSTLLANDAPGLTITGLAGSVDAGFGNDTRLLSTFDLVTGNNDGIIYYEPANGWFRYQGFDSDFSFAYEATDQGGNTLTATVTVTVDNNAPIATPQVVTGAAGTQLFLPLKDLYSGGVFGPLNTDPDGDPITGSSYGLLFSDPRGTLFAEGPPIGNTDPTNIGRLVFTPAPGFTGDVTLPYTIRDLPNLGGADSGGVGASTFTFRVTGEAPPPTTYSLVAVNTTTGEGTATTLSFPFFINRTGTLDAATVTFSVAAGLSGDPAEATDIVGGFRSYTVDFAAGQTFAQVVAVQIALDTLDEPDETFRIVLDGATSTGQTIVIDPAAASFEATIIDNDAPPALPVVSLDAASVGAVNEGDAAIATFNTPLEFVISRTGDLSQAGTVTFTLGAAAGSTLTAADIGFVAQGGNGLGGGFGPFTATFAPTEESRTIFVYAAGDALPEADEGVILTLTGGTGVTLSTTGPLSATGTFTNDDVFPEVSLDAASVGAVAEGDDATAAFNTPLEFVISRTGDLSQAGTVEFTLGAGAGSSLTSDDIGLVTEGGNGLGGGFGPFTAVFAPGQATQTIRVYAAGDTVPEADEAVILTLTGGTNVTLSTTGDLAATGTFTNDDVFPEVSLDAASVGAVAEGDAETAAFNTPLEFVIRRTGDLSEAGTVEFTLGAGAGSTLTAADIGLVVEGSNGLGSGFGPFTAVFAPGQETETIRIYAAGDTVPEADEAVILTLTGGTNVTLSTTGPLSVTGTFANDDVLPTLSIVPVGATTAAEGNETIGGQIGFQVVRSGQTDKFGSIVAFALDSPDGSFGADDLAFVAVGGTPLTLDPVTGRYTLTFARGETSQIVNVIARGDTVSETDATFRLTVTGGDRFELPLPGAVTGTFVNDDVSGGPGSQILTGTPGVDSLRGRAGDETLLGLGGADTLRGNEGNDLLVGDSGNDLLIGGPGNDTMDGGTGDDSYLVESAGDVVVEQPGEGIDRVTSQISYTLGAHVENLSLGGAAAVNGTGNDLGNSIIGNSADNQIAGLSGNDRLEGRLGNDTLDGGDGADILRGGDGDDELLGGADDDRMEGGNGEDALEGGSGADLLIGGQGDDTLLGDDGADTLRGRDGDDELQGGADNDRLEGGNGDDALDGGSGADVLLGGEGADMLLGGADDDVLEGGAGVDMLLGGAGADAFVFRSIGDADGDTIADFSAANGDRINLRPIDANENRAGGQAFSWIGDMEFGSLAGQLRFASEILEGDVDGDGAADFQIALTGVTMLEADSFWL